MDTLRSDPVRPDAGMAGCRGGAMMARYPIELVCNECYHELEWDVVEGVNIDRIYVKPCENCAKEKEKNDDEN